MGAAIAGYGLAWASYNGALKGTGRPRAPEVVDRMRQAAGALPFLFFLVAILIMATYPLTEARFKEIVIAIQARRMERVAQQGDGPATP